MYTVQPVDDDQPDKSSVTGVEPSFNDIAAQTFMRGTHAAKLPEPNSGKVQLNPAAAWPFGPVHKMTEPTVGNVTAAAAPAGTVANRPQQNWPFPTNAKPSENLTLYAPKVDALPDWQSLDERLRSAQELDDRVELADVFDAIELFIHDNEPSIGDHEWREALHAALALAYERARKGLPLYEKE